MNVLIKRKEFPSGEKWYLSVTEKNWIMITKSQLQGLTNKTRLVITEKDNGTGIPFTTYKITG